MFQSFDVHGGPAHGAGRLKQLRAIMRQEAVDWYLVPHADEHQNEYLPECAERLAWLTGFTGSAGFALIGLDEAHVFSDGRYTVQLSEQIDPAAYTAQDIAETRPSEFLSKTANKAEVAGYDPWLMTIGQREIWAKACEKAELELKPVDNFIDRIWQDQPAPPLGRAFLHPDDLAGETAVSKLKRIGKKLSKDSASHLLLTDPASLAWAFNLRGGDVVHNPLALGFAIVPADAKRKPTLFIDKRKLGKGPQAELAKLADLAPPSSLNEAITGFQATDKIHCDPDLVAAYLADEIEKSGAKIIKQRDPVVAMRAIKNEIELEGARRAHIRDGVAMVRFLAWLDRRQHGTVTEIDAAKKLEEFRCKTAKELNSELREIAFDTISGAGPHAALPHYRVNTDSNALLKANSLYLVDSGGQYPDGTTDITRTITIGEPPTRAITDFTLVLKGHIAIATARFPEGTRGVDLDPLARAELWRAGKDFAHGTGHGVGSYLNVHEGPQSISRRGMEEFRPGMIVSNEPGYYREGEYGIRIENLVIVGEAEPVEGGDLPVHSLETITLCPIDRRLIDADLLNRTECDWLNAYHLRVRKTLSPHLNDDDLCWLDRVSG